MSASISRRSFFVLSTSLLLTNSIFAGTTSRNLVDVRGNPWNPKGKPAEITGTLTVIVADDFVHNKQYHFNFVDGVVKRNGKTSGQHRFKLDLQGHLPGDVQTGSTITASGFVSGSTFYVPHEGCKSDYCTGSVDVGSRAVATRSASGNQTTIVMCLNFTDVSLAWTPAQVNDLMFTSSSSINAYYNESSFGSITFSGQTVGPFNIPYASSSTDYNGWANAANSAATAAGVNLNNYTHRVYVMPQNATGWGGLGTIGGNPSQTWIFYCNYPDIYGHELGHNLGVHHASTPDGAEYGDTSCVMGYSGVGLRHMNAPHKNELGWLGGSRLQTVSSNGTFTLTALETNSTALHAIKIAKPNTNDYWCVSFRTNLGFDASGLPSQYWNRASVHSASTLAANFTYLYSTLDDTQTFTDSTNGITITQTTHDAASATVSVTFTPVPAAPTVTISPSSQTGTAGATKTYTVTVKNNDSAGMPSTTFNLSPVAPGGWSATLNPTSLSLGPGASATSTLTVTSPAGTPNGSNTITVNVADGVNSVHNGSVNATYTVSTVTLAPPTGLSASSRNGKVSLSWKSSSSATGYIINRNGAQIGTSTSAKYTDGTVTRGLSYTYTVQAKDNAGNVSAPSNSVTITAK